MRGDVKLILVVVVWAILYIVAWSCWQGDCEANGGAIHYRYTSAGYAFVCDD